MVNSPENITDTLYKKSIKSINKSLHSLIIGGILAGIFVAIAAITTVTVNHDMISYFGIGFTRLISGIVFSFGLITIVLSGSELFTGNNLNLVAAFHSRSYLKTILRNWMIIYIANFLGSMLLVYTMVGAGIYENGGIGNAMVAITEAKLSLTWSQAFLRGILCNFLVCLAIRVGEASEAIAGKIIGYIFVIGAFVINGFEHSIANMFFIPTGIILGNKMGLNLKFIDFLTKNLIPVTLGNIAGGALLIGMTYYFMHNSFLQEKSSKKKELNKY